MLGDDHQVQGLLQDMVIDQGESQRERESMVAGMSLPLVGLGFLHASTCLGQY
jgi:hypothetical protein